MSKQVWHTGVFGTFDVQNYGDLLFPLIAEVELAERLGTVKVRPFSYHAKRPPEWPYKVTSITELPQLVDSLDGVLLGGGHIVRFDKEIAPAYGPPLPTIHHPTGYWLTPALIALQQGIPVIWNAPGTYGEIPTWAQPLMKLSLKLSSYIAVRDEQSRVELTGLADGAPIDVTPDTAFGIAKLLETGRPTAEFLRLRENSRLTTRYIVVQATPGMAAFQRFIKNNSQLFRDFRFLALPIGPVLGDDEAILDDLPGMVRLSKWPHPLLLAEIISHSAGVIGRSYHLMITALAFGVPIFSITNLSLGKHAGLSSFETIHSLTNDSEIDPQWFLERLGRTAPCEKVLAARDQLCEHWDRIAAAIREGPSTTQATVNRFWQSLPSLLEDSDELSKLLSVARLDIEARDKHIAQLDDRIVRLDDYIERQGKRMSEFDAGLAQRDNYLAQRAEQVAQLEQEMAQRDSHIARLDAKVGQLEQEVGQRDHDITQLEAQRAWLDKQLIQRDEHLAQRDERIARIYGSPSWKVTAPARSLMRTLKTWRGKNRPGMIDLEQMEQVLESHPFSWGLVNNLFSPKDARSLVASFPSDHFKTVAGYDGEKSYEYEARALIAMGANTISHAEELSAAWLALAQDFLSPGYRSAMSSLTGRDLTRAQIEVNVFHYGPRACLGPHVDLPEKLVTHVLYFNKAWNRADGGCLTILRSSDPNDVVTALPPIIGSSAVLLRSDKSWHAVSPVVRNCSLSRRSLTATFYQPGSISTLWPPGESAALHRYDARNLNSKTPGNDAKRPRRWNGFAWR